MHAMPPSFWERVRRWLRVQAPRLYLTRCSWMLALVLVGVVPFSLYGLPTMFRSLFVLDASGIMWVALFATMASFTFMATRRTVLLCGPRRFNVEWTYVGEDLKLASLLGHLLTAIPVIATVVWLSAAETDLTGSAALASAAKGVVGGFGAMLGVTLLYALMTDANRALPELVLPDNPVVQAAHRQRLPERLHRQVVRLTPDRWPSSVRGVLRTLLGPGYFDDQGRVLPAHLFAAALLFVFIVLYVRGYLSWQPGTAAGAATPALVYILVIATLLTSLLAGVAFYFDRHRLPTLFVVGVWCLMVWSFSRSDHYFALQEPRTTPALLSPSAVAAARDPHRMLVVVAADGGGIQASAWAATALTGIQQQWPEFRHSVRLISAVSGGSVGTMYFVAALTKDGPRPQRLEEARNAALTGSLNEAAWGLAYPDLWRVMAPSPSRYLKDRSWAMEQVWQRGLDVDGPQTLADLRAGINEGWRPAVTFNATAVESGQRVALATFAPPKAWNVDTLERLYGGRDLRLTTAARLSATFPYVTAIARADTDADTGPAATHFGDGGYYDNTAMVLAMRWLDDALDVRPPGTPRQTVAFVRLRSFPLESELRAAQGKRERDRRITDRGWLYETIGPITTLLAVRTASQQERAETELEFLQRLWGLRGVDIARFEFAFRLEAPLSWQLTPIEARRITDQWKSQQNQDELTRLIDLARQVEAAAAARP